MSFSRGNDLALAMRLADAADSITLARYQSIDLVVTTKPDNTPVTDADKATEESLRALLKNHRPDDGIVGEEFGNDAGGAERYWVIDPIDGTKNFLRGVPTWATLIGLIEKQSDGREVVVVGVVSAPALFRRWHASEGHGAFVSVNKAAPEPMLHCTHHNGARRHTANHVRHFAAVRLSPDQHQSYAIASWQVV